MHRYTLTLALVVGLLTSCTVAREADPRTQRAVLDRALIEWTTAWSSSDAAKLMPLFSDDVYYEDVTFAAVMKDKRALRDFATTVFGAFSDLSFEPKSRFIATNWNQPHEELVRPATDAHPQRSVRATEKYCPFARRAPAVAGCSNRLRT